jgi:hydroquinone glucosyltransferase
MLATPGMGHLIPLAELAKRLASRHGATATLITFASAASATQRALLASLPPAVSSLSLPPVDLSDLPSDAAIETLMSEECARSLPALTRVLSELGEATTATGRLVAFVADQFGIDSFDAARDAGVRTSRRPSPASSGTSPSRCACPAACPSRGPTFPRRSRTGPTLRSR